MESDFIPPAIEAVRRWSGVECPNAAARHGLADFVALMADLHQLHGTMEFEDEPSSFELALRACMEPEA